MQLCERKGRSKNLALSTADDGVWTSDYIVDDDIGLNTSSTT